MTASVPTTYAIRVAGHLDDHWSTRLGGLSITSNGDGTSTLAGPVPDQAMLHGVLAGLRDIGATLLDLRATSRAAPGGRPAIERPLHTERLTLRAARTDDADPTWRRPESVDQWLPGRPAGLAAQRERVTDPARLATRVVVHRRRDPRAEVVAELVLRRVDASAQLEVGDRARGAQAEMGWVLDPAHHGHGYATEAVRELLRHCFEDLGLHRVTAGSLVDDLASRRLMQRLGMRRESHERRAWLDRSGRWRDTVGYALLSEEWTG